VFHLFYQSLLICRNV